MGSFDTGFSDAFDAESELELMAYITAALRLLESFLASSGRFSGGVTIGQPTAPPETPAAAIFLARGSASLLTTTTFQREREVTMRVYMDTSIEPIDEAEIALDEMVYDTEQDLREDLGLSATGWIVLGPINEEYGYVEVGGRNFRTVDITLPLRYRA